jgi:LysM repeat protein
MLRSLLFVILFAFCSSVFAQKPDSVYVMQSYKGWLIKHKIKTGETVFSIARNYHVPPNMVTELNNLTYQQDISSLDKIFIPVGAYNFLNKKPSSSEALPLYFKTDKESPLYKIAKNSNVAQSSIQEWNGLKSNQIQKGKILLVGWLLYDETNIIKQKKPEISKTPDFPTVVGKNKPVPLTEKIIPQVAVTGVSEVSDSLLSEGEIQFIQQTDSGKNIMEEKGTAAFFKRPGKPSNRLYLAFHATAPRGTIIRIYNPGTDKTVYAKVIGQLPQTENFYKAILGLSSDAKQALDVREGKSWVEITYRQL